MQRHELTKIEQNQAEQHEPTELAEESLQDVIGGMSVEKTIGIAVGTGLAGIAAGVVITTPIARDLAFKDFAKTAALKNTMQQYSHVK